VLALRLKQCKAMRRKRLLLLISGLILLAAAIAVLLAPILVASALRVWARWQTSQHGLLVDLGRIEAPLFRPVTIRSLRIRDTKDALYGINFNADQVVLDLNLSRILLGTRGRAVRSLSTRAVSLQTNRNLPSEQQKWQVPWATLQKLLPGRFNLPRLDLRIEDGPNVFLLRNCALSVSETEAGRFTAGEMTIASPLVHQTFSNLRGATKWQDNRLTVGGITLARGLDLLSATLDLTRLGKERVDFQFDLDTFGGKIRASFSDEWRPGHAVWDFAGSANDISLAQTAEALGFADRLGGSLHACKLTFRGDPRDLMRATASTWFEVTDLSWRNRAAEVIMVGVALYNRQIQLQQLYVKQRNNELTMSGQGSLPEKSSDWRSPDFRGTISSSINDLGAFASLFGAKPDDFGGAVAIDGTVNAREREIGGHVTATANSLSIFKTQIDSFLTNFSLRSSALEIEQLDLRRKQDWLHAEGRIDFDSWHNYTGSLSADLKNLSDYVSFFGPTDPVDSNPASAHLQFMADSGVWNGTATITTPTSRVDIGAISLPLRIGETWNEFSMTPLNIIFTFPVLSLDKSPSWLGLGVLDRGILSGGIRLFGTLAQPKLEGDVQLINGQTKATRLGVDRVSGRLRLAGDHGTIDFLQLSNTNVDLALRGEVQISAADDIAVDLTATLPLFDRTSYPLECVNGFIFSPMNTMLAPVVNQIEFHGGLINRRWTVSLRPKTRGLVELMSIAERTIPICFDQPSNGKALLLGPYSPPQPAPSRHRKPARNR
jgi:hypothetical protein